MNMELKDFDKYKGCKPTDSCALINMLWRSILGLRENQQKLIDKNNLLMKTVGEYLSETGACENSDEDESSLCDLDDCAYCALERVLHD